MPVITLRPQKATKKIMEGLEQKGFIQRLTSQNAEILGTPQNQTLGKTLYETEAIFGTHKLISVSVNRTDIKSGIGHHPDKEEFLLISTPAGSRPLYLAICHLSRAEFENKVQAGHLCEGDFLLLEMPYCEPEVSFFTMNPGVLHGEATLSGPGACPVFYVTEPSALPLNLMDFQGYTLELAQS